MSTYLGDFRTGKTVRKAWNSNAIAGESVTRATNGTISVYKDGNTTQSTAGVTDTEDFDSLTGVHLVAIDTSADGTFYSAGSEFEVILSAATIDGKTINATLFSFSLENRSALMPTTDGRKLDVSAGGEAGLDWANVGTPGSTVSLSATTVATVSTATAVTTVNGLANNVITANSINTAALTAAKFGAGAIDAAALAADAGAEIATAVRTELATELGRIDVATSTRSTVTTAQVQTECEEALQTYHLDHLIHSADPGGVVADSSFLAKLASKSATPSFASYNNQTDALEALRDRGDAAWITATGFATSAALSTVEGKIDTIDTIVDAILDDTGTAGVVVADKTGYRLSATGVNDILRTALTEGYAADGAAPTLEQFAFMLWSVFAQFDISGTTITTRRLDGTTSAMTFTLDSSTAPTSRTRS